MDDPYAFQLDPQLEKDTVPIADWHLCQVRLMNDSRYPWVILIPKVPDIAGSTSWPKSNNTCY